MASARQAALQARRQSYNPYGTGTRIKLLTPSNNTISSLVKKSINNELDVMVKKYNAGQVSNADFLSFLKKIQGSSGLSEADRADVDLQINDFNSRILGETLATAFKAAPDNTGQQLQAAQALVNYFKNRASGFQPDTPAYTDAMNNVAAYEADVMQIQKNITTKARQNQRYVLEQEVNKIPSGTSESAAKKAEMWKTLYDQAVADGDMVAANQYAANYEQEATNTQVYGEKEIAKENKTKINDFINTTLNDYHRGKISGDEAILRLSQADQFAADTGDINSQLRLQSLYQTISREVDRGITYTSNGEFGVKSSGGSGTGEFYLNADGSVSYGGGYVSNSTKSSTSKSVGNISSGGNKTVTSTIPSDGFNNGRERSMTPAELDIQYQNTLNDLNKALVSGEINGDEYTTGLQIATKSRQIDLQQLTQGLQGVADPNTKLGKKALSLLETYSTELTNVTSEYNDLRTGRLVVGLQDSSFKDPTGRTIGKKVLGLIPKDKNAVNVNGVYYKPQAENLMFGSQNDANNFLKQNKNDAALKGAKAVQGDDGRYYVATSDGAYVQGNVLHVNDTNGNDIIYQDEGGGFLPVGLGPKTAALRSRVAQERETATKDGQPYDMKFMNYNDINKFDFSTPIPQPVKKPGFIENVTNTVKNVVDEIPKVIPASQYIPPQQTTPNPINSSIGQISLPQNIGSGNRVSIGPEPLKLAGTPSPVNTALKQAINPTGNTPIKVAAPPAGPGTPQQAAKAAQSLPDPNQYSVTNSLKKLGNTLLGWTGLKF